MNVLVANIGSTSFKYRLYAMPGEQLLARGGVERIGAPNSRSYVFAGGETVEVIAPVPDHGAAVSACLKQLTDPKVGCLKDASELAAIGFKAVHAQGLSGVQIVDEKVLDAMEAFSAVAPAHNPPYLKAMRQLRAAFPRLPLVAAFETGFHLTAPDAHRYYAVPFEWYEKFGIQRWGFHGASHRYIAGRIAEVSGRADLRVISCHLGGSSSLAAIAGGKSLGNSMGMSPQSGLPHNNRVGDFDLFALPVLLRETGKSLEELLDTLAEHSGLAGLSGAGNDLRDIETAAEKGDRRAKLAMDVFVASIRDYLGAFLVRLGGADAIVFTGGIGENSASIRASVCAGLEGFGIELDPEKNRAAKGEVIVSSAASRTQIWTMPTNEEIVVARQSYERLKSK
ncbi:MAG: acetate/propionate family kinase [Planctomycetota bacterium]